MKIEVAFERIKEMKDDVKIFHWDKIDKSFIRGGISDGVNKFDIPQMYKTYMKKEIDSYGEFVRYGDAYGSQFLADAFKLYEQIIACKGELPCDNYCKYMTVTSGASSAIFLLFSYLSDKYKDYKVKMLGWQYYLFDHHCKNFSLDYQYIISKNDNRIIPTIDEIYAELGDSKNNIIVLTMPGNPSGEIYNYEEIVEICKLCVANNNILIIDKCQQEILAQCFEYVNIGAAVLEAGAEDIVIFIDSISKTRSIPGGRIGYIFSNSQEMFEYINYYISIIYTCPTRGLESAIGMDIIARCLFYVGYKKEILSKFRYLIILDCGYKVYAEVYEKILSNKEKLEKMLNAFILEIQQNSEQIKKNYEKARSVFQDIPGCKVTNLQGGFNFCVFLSDEKREGEESFISKMNELVDAKLISQCFWGATRGIKGEEGYWCRISIAVKDTVMENYLDRLRSALIEVKNL
ncbi:aminotransferase class I/II-fold pyridoxal phosphate-dependent enzyme [Eubacterium ventriosum]|uniref:Aminotransferase n=1 Tax=Eubacterium ventriosum TaxID=39496 RepID=A0A415LH55_9FIRM|nr:aminotransferase class I/II-fold pyridoxal phosphate-dependent enzyme [Eubacterium ventriosum]RHL47899.1 aminotransferase class I/II-fold pyridoxal phosphate-dependent enzyme [Eubacterium ventriosum]